MSDDDILALSDEEAEQAFDMDPDEFYSWWLSREV